MQVGYSLPFRYDVVERDESDASPERRSTFPYGRQVVREHPQQMAGCEVEEVGTHESASQQIASGQPLDFRLVEALAACLLRAHRQARTAETGDLGWMGAVSAAHEKAVGGDAHQGGSDGDQDVLRLDFAPPMFTFKDPDDNLWVLIEDEVEQ